MAVFPGAVSTDSDLYVAVNTLSCLLTDNPLTIGATTVNVNTTTGFPSVGAISIDAEIIFYSGITATSFTGCSRGFDGSSAAAHSLGAQVDHNVIAVHHNVLKDEVKAVEQFISDLIGRTSTQVKGPDGTASLPGYSFASQTDLGIARLASNTLNFIATSVSIAKVDPAGLTITGGYDILLTSSSSIKNSLGSVSAPSYSFSTDINTGFYSPAADQLAATVGGTLLWHYNGTSFLVNKDIVPNTTGTFKIGQSGSIWTELWFEKAVASIGSASLPSYTFSGDTNTGMWHLGADAIAFALGGSDVLQLESSVISALTSLGVTDGTVSAPSIRLSSDTDTGLYKIGSNNIGITCGATRVIDASTTGVRILGTTTNNNATAGDIGETITSIVSVGTNFPASGQYGDLTSITLSAGDWLVCLYLEFNPNGATVTDYQVGMGTASGNSATGLASGDTLIQGGIFTLYHSDSMPFSRYSLSGSQTVYLKYFATYSVATPKALGKLVAVRIR